MIQLENGQPQAEQEQPNQGAVSSANGSSCSGQKLIARPWSYWQNRASKFPYDHICRLLHVSEYTLKAIEKAESLSIAERKQRLLDEAVRIASKAADRVEDQIHGANITQAVVGFGVLLRK